MNQERFKKIRTTLNNSIGFILFLVCAVAIYNKVASNDNLNEFGDQIKQQFYTIGFFQWAVLIILFVLNYLMESIKWKLVLAELNPTSILKSFKSVLVGQAFAFFTPARSGDYVGRILFLAPGNKLKGLAQMAWASYAQLLITLFFGSKIYNTPFNIKLDDFIADKYPGTDKSYSAFKSKVEVIDSGNKKTFKDSIFMNNVLDYEGYRFFQSGFDPDEKGTQLSVSHDFWGTWITYIGYFLLYFGMMAYLIYMAAKNERGIALLLWILAMLYNPGYRLTLAGTCFSRQTPGDLGPESGCRCSILFRSRPDPL